MAEQALQDLLISGLPVPLDTLSNSSAGFARRKRPDKAAVNPSNASNRFHGIVKYPQKFPPYFGGEAEGWMKLQTVYDLKRAELAQGDRIREEIKPRAA